MGLLGPNGAGKTTCFYMIVGLIAVDEGTIQVDDVDITHQPVNVRSSLGVGYLPQDASIFRKLTVEQNILAILENRDDLDRAGEKVRHDLVAVGQVGVVAAGVGVPGQGHLRQAVVGVAQQGHQLFGGKGLVQHADGPIG